MSLSSVTFSGTLRKDPEKRFTPSNIPVTNLTIDVCFIPRGMQAQQEGLSSQTIRVNAWRDLAEICEKNLKAGDKVLVIGRAQINAYTTNEGKKKREIEVDATSVVSLSDVLSTKPPAKSLNENEGNGGKATFKKSTEDVEEISSLEEVISGSEEIPF